jgi:ribonuclease HI
MPTSRAKPAIVAHIDGASRGNPGPAAYGVVIETAEGGRLATLAKRLGQTTNNFAEYRALLAALEYALEHKHLRVKAFSDSELLVRQMQGAYKVKSLDLKPLYERAREMVAQLEFFAIHHVPREQNREADRLANQALDGAGADTRAVASPEGPSLFPNVPLRALATYEQGVLKPRVKLPLGDGETVEIEIHRRK